MAENKIVVCVDGSQNSENAFKWYLKTFHRPSHKVVLCHVPESWQFERMMSPARIKELIEESKAKTIDLQAGYDTMCKQMALEADFQVLEGKEAWHAVCKFAESIDAKAIVVGTRGMGTLKRAVLGSVSASILHHSSVPVLIYRDK